MHVCLRACLCVLSPESFAAGNGTRVEVHGAAECDVNAQCCPGPEAMHCIVKGHACVCVCLCVRLQRSFPTFWQRCTDYNHKGHKMSN